MKMCTLNGIGPNFGGWLSTRHTYHVHLTIFAYVKDVRVLLFAQSSISARLDHFHLYSTSDLTSTHSTSNPSSTIHNYDTLDTVRATDCVCVAHVTRNDDKCGKLLRRARLEIIILDGR